MFRGRGKTIEADRAVSERMLDVAAEGEVSVRVWVPHRQVAFGRRDARLAGYEPAQTAARDRGFPPVERSVGGRAVAYDGETTIAFARTEPIADFRRGASERYERMTDDVSAALDNLGVDVVRGEPDDSFCPGTHSLSTASTGNNGGKLVGIAQRVTSEAALVSGVLVVDHEDELAAVLDPVYGALGVPFDSESMGSVVSATGPIDSKTVRTTLETALSGNRLTTVERIGRTGSRSRCVEDSTLERRNGDDDHLE